MAELSAEEMSGTRHDEVYGFHRHAYHFIVLQFVFFLCWIIKFFALLCAKEAALMDKKCFWKTRKWEYGFMKWIFH